MRGDGYAPLETVTTWHIRSRKSVVTPGAIARATVSMTCRPKRHAARIFAIAASLFTSSFLCHRELNSSSGHPVVE